MRTCTIMIIQNFGDMVIDIFKCILLAGLVLYLPFKFISQLINNLLLNTNH